MRKRVAGLVVVAAGLLVCAVPVFLLGPGCGDSHKTAASLLSTQAERTPKNPTPPQAKVKLDEAETLKTPAEAYDHVLEIYEEALALLEWIENREDAEKVRPRLARLQMELSATKAQANRLIDRPFDVMHRYLEKGSPLCEQISKHVKRLNQMGIESGWPARGVMAFLE